MRAPFMVKVWMVIAGVGLILASEAGWFGHIGEEFAQYVDATLGWFWALGIIILAVVFITECLAILFGDTTTRAR